MNDEYYVKIGHLDDQKFHVIFGRGTIDNNKGQGIPQPQVVTFCLIRLGLRQLGLGVTVSNPHDSSDDETGQQIALKRAVDNMIDRHYPWYDRYAQREVLRQFRRARWEQTRRDQ